MSDLLGIARLTIHKDKHRNQAAAAERLAEDMERYVLKRDGTRRSLVTDEEAQAAQRALAFLAGRRHMAFHD